MCLVKMKKNNNISWARETSAQGERDGTPCAIVNQLWARLLFFNCKYFVIVSISNSTVG
jgi:hypothetical protein